MPSKSEYLLWELQGLFSFLKEYRNPLHNVEINKPEGQIKNRWWIETRAWDNGCTVHNIRKYFRKQRKIQSLKTKNSKV